ncbi:MAG: flagellar biosynthetic protein FliO [Candidatus Eisenbacteria bacterium]|uniref:Flagellar biosynthetic protein FliO n=1 Tax=Eiseniibacteriota bacterium TaxID=2212470 RepID=A0A538TG65_UNCEI|nr:MAG: flagellar biosynthetic protein FliO [Candidatus Eisenbacteria bacterium]
MSATLIYTIAIAVGAITLVGATRVFWRRNEHVDDASMEVPPEIRLLTRARMGRGRTLVVIEVEGRRILLGSTREQWTALADLGAASLRAEEDPFAPFDAELSRAMHATRYRKGWKHS